MSNNTTLQSTFKSKDTEETIDIYFTRPIGLLWAKFFNALNVHPNVVTILSIFLGIAAGHFMAYGYESWTNTLAGIALLMWANFYDSCDGQLARMTGKKTQWGRVLDGFAGDVWFICIYAAIAFRVMSQPIVPGWSSSSTWSFWIWILFYFIGFHVHGAQSRLADYYRNIHLYFIKGAAGSELHNSAQLRAEFAQLKWRENFVWKLFLHFYCDYTAAQEKKTPRFQAFKRALDARYGRELPESLVKEFRAGSLPLMKWANVLTFNWRAITLYASLIIGIYQPLGVLLYPLCEITIFVLIYRHMHNRHETLCARMLQQLNP